MPELPEVETVVRGLRGPLEGRRLTQVIARRADLRIPLPRHFARRLEGRRILRLNRRAKYIVAELDDGGSLLCHLGMSGRMIVAAAPGPPPGPHDHVILRTDAGLEVRFCDPRRFGLMDLVAPGGLAQHPLLAGLGPEPLGNDFSGPVLAARLAGRRTTIKAALLDQRVVAGLGNIYACESLFFAGLSPRRRAGSVQGARAERLAAAIRSVLMRAIEAGGSSLRDYVQASGELGYFQHEWAVYDRAGQPCPGCTCGHGTIRRIVQAGRSTFYCGRRQR
ncbi:MAG: bifunctional DNA-formamidopyrimidine glycosylase/DNA-(apurinic or apyrimidinic site) lyase [Alphaproteobacteria bacterium]|nr:MAG: bifunctional DNA-formamidopyrimidine glycosylase/DNA-(apurinic or apyrimidinic site) lyase [Alphaproteobacteria bacterium]